MTAAALLVLLVGCTTERRDVGTATDCPHRKAYCPVAGPGVVWPGRPLDSPSGRFRARVLPGLPSTPADTWRFEVIDTKSGAIVLSPNTGLDGGLGTVVAWDQRRTDTLWATGGQVTRWRFDTEFGRWVAEKPDGDVLPNVVAETIASDPG